MSDKVETKIIQIMAAEKGWEACCYQVFGDKVTVVYQHVIGWALVSRREGYESDMEGVPVSETRVEPLFLEPDSSTPVIPSDVYAFRLWGLVGPDDPRDEDDVVDQIREGLAERKQRWSEHRDSGDTEAPG
jgi:hypothetical protein